MPELTRLPFRRTQWGPILTDGPAMPIEQLLAPGVTGYTMDVDGALWIPVITAAAPGTGHVAAFLDGLPTDRTVVVPNVLSERLAGMLERRGFVARHIWCDEFEENVMVMERTVDV